MKITLILAASPKDPLKKTDPFMPLSLPLLAASAPEHDYTFVDMLAGEDIDFDKPADLVGISSRITAKITAFRIADEFRKRGVKVVLGGPEMSSSPYEAILHADAVVIGEAEGLWPMLLDDLKNSSLKNFYISSPVEFDNKSYSKYQEREFLDLSKVPIAARYIYNRRYTFDTVFASRGCPIDCDFCSVSKLFGKNIRLRPVDDVVKEIASFKNYYYLLDDTVFGRANNYDYYLELYEKIAALKKVNFWTGQANLDAASTEKGRAVIKKAAQAGFLYAAIGMESINFEVLKKSGTINKMGAGSGDDYLQRMKENIRFIQDQGIFISGWFAIGYEEDTIDSYYKTLEFCLENNIIPVISPLEALPGTRLYDKLIKENKVDASKKINVVHPNIKDADVMIAMEYINRVGYSNKEILKRTMFYSKRFDKDNPNTNQKINNKIHKTIFTYITQKKLKQGVIGLANNEFSEMEK